MGFVEHRAKHRYRARFRGPDGREGSKTFRRRIDAERFLVSVESAKLKGEWIDPAAGKVSLGDFAEDWMSTVAHLRPSTRNRYGSLLRVHILPALGYLPLAGIRPLDIQAFVSGVLDSGVSATTAHHAYRLLSEVLKAAQLDGRIGRNPAAGVSPPARRWQEQRYLTAEEVWALAEAVDVRYRALILTRRLRRAPVGRAGWAACHTTPAVGAAHRYRRDPRGGREQPGLRAAQDWTTHRLHPGAARRRARSAPDAASAGGGWARVHQSGRHAPASRKLLPPRVAPGAGTGGTRPGSKDPRPQAHERRPSHRRQGAPEGDPGTVWPRLHRDDPERVWAPIRGVAGSPRRTPRGHVPRLPRGLGAGLSAGPGHRRDAWLVGRNGL